MTKMKKAELELELSLLQRRESAYFEWFREAIRGEKPFVMVVLPDVLSVQVFGMGRACGGVAVVYTEGLDWFEAPVYLSDLLSRWRRDPTWEIRDACTRLQALSELAMSDVMPAARVMQISEEGSVEGGEGHTL